MAKQKIENLMFDAADRSLKPEMFPFDYVLFVITLKIRFGCCSSHLSARDQDQSKQAKEVNEVVVYTSQGKGCACSHILRVLVTRKMF